MNLPDHLVAQILHHLTKGLGPAPDPKVRRGHDGSPDPVVRGAIGALENALLEIGRRAYGVALDDARQSLVYLERLNPPPPGYAQQVSEASGLEFSENRGRKAGEEDMRNAVLDLICKAAIYKTRDDLEVLVLDLDLRVLTEQIQDLDIRVDKSDSL